nr:unnamed protein product [Spirometra erinaceieuropaei]
MSLASASVPAPPGVFATSMPPDLSSEERESTSERSLHHSIMVNGTVLSPALGTSGNPSKSPHFVMVREEDGNSYKHPNKIRKRNKSGRRSLHSSKDATELRYLNGSHSPQYGSLSSGNKPLKVTIRRTALSHTLDSHKATCNPDHDAYSSSSPSNSVIYSSSSSSSHCVLKAAEDDRPRSVTPKPTSQSANPSLCGAQSPSSSSSTSSFHNPKTLESVGADLSSTSPSIHSSVEPPKQPPATDQPPSRRDASTSTRDCATITEPDLLGPCEPGSKIVLEGIVWLETPEQPAGAQQSVTYHWPIRVSLLAEIGPWLTTEKEPPPKRDLGVSLLTAAYQKCDDVKVASTVILQPSDVKTSVGRVSPGLLSTNGAEIDCFT